MKSCPQMNHWCGHDYCEGNIHSKVNPYCSVVRGDGLACRRISGHAGHHSGYGRGVNQPDEWDAA